MAKKIRLSIPKPCHEDWDQMHPVEKGRFCDSCQKKVVDFSEMSDREIAQFFKKPSNESTCGRFMQDQLDRDIVIPKKRIPWVKYFFQVALPAFIISAKANAQGKEKGEVINVGTKKLQEWLKQPHFAMCTFFPGIITSDTIPLSQCNAAMVAGGIRADFNKSILDDTITLPEVVVFANTLTVMGGWKTTGVVIKKSEEIITTKKDTVLTQIIKNIFPGSFKVYPNPAQQGVVLNIAWSQKESGNFLLQLLALSGQLVYTKEMYIDPDARLLDLQLPNVPAGTYVLVMSNKETGKRFSEKVIIQ
jgi:hypothetical protein